MNDVISESHKELAAKVKSLISVYSEAEDLINLGAYVKGSNPRIDEALIYIDEIRKFLIQDVDEKVDFEETLRQLKRIFEGEQ
jgi:flagellum-specific ATP synthase